jgi:type VI secretion system secreted protein Hcp
MAFDAVLNFNNASNGLQPKGESLVYDGGIPLVDEWSFSLENKLNITQHTTGAGGGKAEFEAFTVKKQCDTASPDLLIACGAGFTFQGVTLRIMKAGGEAKDAKSNVFICWTFNMLVIEKLEWSYADPVPQEVLTLKFGACAIVYGKQSGEFGTISVAGQGSWNQIANSKGETTKIPGSVPAYGLTQ